MSNARTVPGENLSSRLAARGGSRARIGARPAFFQRMGVADPFGVEPELDEMSKNGMFSFLSASGYYRELRSQRMRMMFRLGAVRHRQVAGERLRAAGPRFSAPTALAGASLPSLGELVLLDPERNRDEAEEEEGARLRPRTRSSRPARRRVVRAAERSVERSDAELARALAQVASLTRERDLPRVREVIRDLPSLPAARRPEVVREVIRYVESAPGTRANERPVAVAAHRISTRAMAPLASRATPSSTGSRGPSQTAPPARSWQRPLVDQGPAGLQPVLSRSPSIQATSASAVLERALGRTTSGTGAPEVFGRRTASGPDARRPIRATASPERVELEHADESTDETVDVARAPASRAAAPRRRRASPEAKADPRAIASSGRRSLPSERVARALVAQTSLEPAVAARGAEATGRTSIAPVAAGSLPRMVARSRAGSTESDVVAPLSSAATSWLSDELHPQRRVSRASAAELRAPRTRDVARDLDRFASPVAAQRVASLDSDDRLGGLLGAERRSARRTLDVAGEMETLRPAAKQENAEAESISTRPTARVPGARPRRRPAANDAPVHTRMSRGLGVASLRAVQRAIPDPERVAPSPVRALATGRPVVAPPVGDVLQPVGDDAPPVGLGTRSTAVATRGEPLRRGLGRRESDSEPIAPSADRARTVRRPGLASPVGELLQPTPQDASTIGSSAGPERTAGTRTSRTERPTRRGRGRSEEGRPPMARAVRRGRTRTAAETAFAPLADRVVPASEEPVRRIRSAEMRRTTRPAALDLIALSQVAADEPKVLGPALVPGRRALAATERRAERSGGDTSEGTSERVGRVVSPPTSSFDVESRRVPATRGVLPEESPAFVEGRRSRAATEPRVARSGRATAEGISGLVERVVSSPASSFDVESRRVPATRRALHRAAEPEAVAGPTRVRLAASPAAFVHPVKAQQALHDEPMPVQASPAHPADRPATRALSRSARIARVDERDRAKLAPAPTDYLEVAASADRLAPRPVLRTRAAVPTKTLGAGRSVGRTDVARPVRRVASGVAASRAALGRRASIDLQENLDVAVRPRRAHARRPVVPVEQLVPVLPQQEASEAPVGAARPEAATADIGRSLRQVASSFRAAERDGVHILTVDAARRAVAPADSRSRRPTIEAVLERDEEGRVVRARASRVAGVGAPESVVLDSADFGVETDPTSRAVRRQERAPDSVASRSAAVRVRAQATPTVLARTPTAWAEERADAARGASQQGPVAVAPSTPTRRAVNRSRRPVPEGQVLSAPSAAAHEDLPHRFTAPLAGRQADRRRSSHSANTWAEVAHRVERPAERDRMSRKAATKDAPGWVRRAVEPPIEREEREPPGSRIRSGAGLLTALARAGDPEEVIQVILQRSHQASALARELPGEAGTILSAIASDSTAEQVLSGAAGARSTRGDLVESSLTRRVRSNSLVASPTERSRSHRTRSGQTATSEAHQGVGSSQMMKLASKLKKLIHLAEHARLNEAQAQVRMAHESAEARAELGAGRAGGQSLEEDNMHIERLHEEVLREVQQKLESIKQRSGDSDGWW